MCPVPGGLRISPYNTPHSVSVFCLPLAQVEGFSMSPSPTSSGTPESQSQQLEASQEWSRYTPRSLCVPAQPRHGGPSEHFGGQPSPLPPALHTEPSTLPTAGYLWVPSHSPTTGTHRALPDRPRDLLHTTRPPRSPFPPGVTCPAAPSHPRNHAQGLTQCRGTPTRDLRARPRPGAPLPVWVRM